MPQSVQSRSPAQRLLLRIGVTCVIVGILGLVLPLFGLQLRKFASAGENALYVASGLIAVGAAMSAMSLVRGRTVKYGLIGMTGLIVLGVVTLFIVGYILAHHAKPSTVAQTFTPLPPKTSASPGQAMPNRSSMPAYVPPTNAPPPATYESLAQTFGVARVARIHGVGAKAVASYDLIRKQLSAYQKTQKGAAWRMTKSVDHLDGVVAPVDDLDALDKQMQFEGIETSIDRSSRTIVLTSK